VPLYTFNGIVHPQRAQLSLAFGLSFQHFTTGRRGSLFANVILNQVLIQAECEDLWDIFDLRNVVKSALQTQLSAIAYLKGYAYDLEITRITSKEAEVDFVFGVDIPYIEQRNASIDLNASILRLQELTSGELGLYFQRCLNDLSLAMKFADDTAFYCYRAIESLRLHCAAKHQMEADHKSAQWQKFRAFAGCSEDEIRSIKEAADVVRHGEPGRVDDAGRVKLFEITWSVVERYVNAA
jgi:hypothetical protein